MILQQTQLPRFQNLTHERYSTQAYLPSFYAVASFNPEPAAAAVRQAHFDSRLIAVAAGSGLNENYSCLPCPSTPGRGQRQDSGMSVKAVVPGWPGVGG